MDGGPWLDAKEPTGPRPLDIGVGHESHPGAVSADQSRTPVKEPLAGVITHRHNAESGRTISAAGRWSRSRPATTCTIESGDMGFGNLGNVDVCQTYQPMFRNDACTRRHRRAFWQLAGTVCDAANVDCRLA